MHKEGELELLREALSSEIHFLKSVSVCSEQSFSYCMNKNQPNQTYRHDYLHVRPLTEKIVILKYNKRCSTLLFIVKMLAREKEVQSLFIFILFSGFFVGRHSLSLFFSFLSFCYLQKLDSSQGSERHQVQHNDCKRKGFTASPLVSSVKITRMLLNGREEEEKDDRKEQTEGDYKLCSLGKY